MRSINIGLHAVPRDIRFDGTCPQNIGISPSGFCRNLEHVVGVTDRLKWHFAGAGHLAGNGHGVSGPVCVDRVVVVRSANILNVGK